MRPILLLAAVAVALLPMAALAEDAAKLNVPPEGFTALFNGKDLTSWKTDGGAAEHWTANDGVLSYDGKGRSLQTEKDFGNFVLYVDWKIEKGGDSGIFLRGRPQVQIWNRPEGSGGLWNNKEHESKPVVAADNPVGEWNTFQIKLVGEKVTVHLNGKLVVDDTPMDTLKGRKEGPIVLQHHGHTLWFRNIFIQELPAEE